MMGQTFSPFDFSRTPMEEVLIPFPRPDKTPPVTMTYFTSIHGIGPLGEFH